MLQRRGLSSANQLTGHRVHAFDYIIIGAGSAGCVLANRLSADPKVRVLLLEAGPRDWHPFIHMPAGLAKLVGKKGVNWDYDTAPEPQLDNRTLWWPRGKVLGGSSSINAMCYVRGHARDYDDWAAQGATGWDWNSVLPYFKRNEGNRRGRDDLHGELGPLAVSDLRYTNPLSQVFIDAAAQAGYPRNNDFNGHVQEGVGFYQVTQKDGARCSAAVAYLHPVRHRKNLVVRTGAMVSRITFEQGRANGVTCAVNGAAVPLRMHARSVALRRRDQFAAVADALGRRPGRSAATPRHQGRARRAERRREPAGPSRHLHAAAFHAAASPTTARATRRSRSNISCAATAARAAATSPRPAASCVHRSRRTTAPTSSCTSCRRCSTTTAAIACAATATRCTPASCVRAAAAASRSSAPRAHDKPRIEANYLSDPEGFDLRMMIECAKAVARDLPRSRPSIAFRGAPIFPARDDLDDEGLEAFVRAKAETVYHPVGTCRMGSDAASVVDPQLRVRGVEGLRVVDASVMPTLIGGNTNAPTMMIAERVSELMTAG